jgi:putative hemolysin
MMSEFLVFLGLLLVSAFFSGSETAFFSLSKLKLKEMEEDGTPGGVRIASMLMHPQHLLITILIGNTLVNTGAATLAALLTHKLALQFGFPLNWAMLLDVVGVTVVLLVFSEVTPKVYAIRNAESWARFAGLPIRIFGTLASPLIWPVLTMTRYFKKRLRGDDHLHLTGEELRTLVEVGEEHGSLEEDEKKMIHSIFEFGETMVREVMIPRIDMVALPADGSIAEAVELIRREGHSRIPLYRDRIDNVTGILFAKDLIPYLHKQEASLALDQLARLPYFVPEGKKIDELLHEFQTGRIHMAIAVDEYGGTAGLVTLEDVLEEIVGEIQDEFDSDARLYRQTSDGAWVIDSQLDLEDANELFGEELLPTEDDYETLGGFIYELAGEVPSASSQYDHLGWRFTVMTMKRHRIGLIKAERLDVASEHEQENGTPE